MSPEPNADTPRLLPAIRRVPIENLTIFEVEESELELLERGAPDSLFLNFAIALLTLALSFSVTFATTKIDDSRTFTVLVVVTVVSYIVGTMLAIYWIRNHTSVSAVADRIRNRSSSKVVASQLTEDQAH